MMYEVQVFAVDYDKKPGSIEYAQIERKYYPYSPLGSTPMILP